MSGHFRTLLLLGCLSSGSLSQAQQESSRADTTVVTRTIDVDSLNWRMRHSPGKATLYSAILPGAGQIYNRKYWKAPIVWIGMGLSLYFIQDNSKQYVRYRDGYVALIDNDPSTVSEFEGANAESVRSTADTYKKWRDQSWIALSLIYVLNIVDASVDAHFVRFDVGTDLSMELTPTPLIAGQRGVGLSLALALR